MGSKREWPLFFRVKEKRGKAKRSEMKQEKREEGGHGPEGSTVIKKPSE